MGTEPSLPVLVVQPFRIGASNRFSDRPYMESDVSVYNSGNLGSPVGPIDSIFGFAYVINETEPGKLCVNLRQGRPECGDCEYQTSVLHIQLGNLLRWRRRPSNSHNIRHYKLNHCATSLFERLHQAKSDIDVIFGDCSFTTCTSPSDISALQRKDVYRGESHLLLADWVIKLGNATFREDGLYQYSIVTTPDRLQLFVLARDVDTFRAEYQEEVDLSVA